MKKSKKALLWTIVPVLGVSSGVAGAIAGVTSQKTSVDTNNVATSSTATTMATSRSTSKAANELKITVQPYDVLVYSGDTSGASMNVWVEGTTHLSNLKYTWKVNKGDGQGWQLHTSGGTRGTRITVPTTKTLLNWTFRCEIVDWSTGWTAVSKDAKFTVAPIEGKNIRITKQPEANKTVIGGDQVTISTKAETVGSYRGKEIGYQWFEYDSENNTFTKIAGANSSSYTFKAPYYSTTQTKKYVCKYYVDNQTTTYLSESEQSVITINKGERETIKIDSLKADQSVIKSGEKTTLSVTATSSKTTDLKYQWYKANDEQHFEKIDGANKSTYEYTATDADANKTLIFMVMVEGAEYYLQSNNLLVKVVPSETGVNSEVPSKELKVKSEIWGNQAAVNSNFKSLMNIDHWWYKVEVQGQSSSDNVTYQWYYVGQDGKEHEISGEKKSTLSPNSNSELFKSIYEDNASHRVDIICKVYKNGQLSNIVGKTSESTDYNHRFFMTVMKAR